MLASILLSYSSHHYRTLLLLIVLIMYYYVVILLSVIFQLQMFGDLDFVILNICNWNITDIVIHITDNK